jgi:Polysaccharide deacetylase
VFSSMLGTWMRALFAVFSLSISVSALAQEVVLVKSEKTSAFFRNSGGDYERLLGEWRSSLGRVGVPFKELSIAQSSTISTPGVLILASAVVLDDVERKALIQARALGWSILATWATGARDANAQWLGYDFLSSLTGAKVLSDISNTSDEWFLLPYGETPITGSIPAGQRIYLTKGNEQLLRVNAANGAARFGSWVRQINDTQSRLSAISFSEDLSGAQSSRVVYFGFAESTWADTRVWLDRLVADSVGWLQRRPSAVKSAWPHPHEAAFLFEMDTEDRFENAAVMVDHLDRRNLPATFYMLTSEAVKHPDLVRRIAAKYEAAYHAEVHDGFKGLPLAEQQRRLGTMVTQMKSIVGDTSRITGFRAPLEQFDANTEITLRKLGIRHHAANPDSRSDTLPGFSGAEPGLKSEDALVVLPRTWLDDINYQQMALNDPERVRFMFVEGLRDNLATRGFGLMSVHSQNFQRGSVLDRNTVHLLDEVQAMGPKLWNGLEVNLSLGDRQIARNVRVTVMPPRKTTAAPPTVSLVMMPPGAPTAGMRLERLDEYRWAMVFPELRSGQYKVHLRF